MSRSMALYRDDNADVLPVVTPMHRLMRLDFLCRKVLVTNLLISLQFKDKRMNEYPR